MPPLFGPGGSVGNARPRPPAVEPKEGPKEPAQRDRSHPGEAPGPAELVERPPLSKENAVGPGDVPGGVVQVGRFAGGAVKFDDAEGPPVAKGLVGFVAEVEAPEVQ